MKYGYPFVKIVRNEIIFLDGRFCNLPSEYLNIRNEAILKEFYRDLLSVETTKDVDKHITIGCDPLGFTYIILDFICYIGLVTNSCPRKQFNKLRKQYPENHFSIQYLKKQINFEFELLNFREFIPIEIVTQNLHEIRGLNAKISANIDSIMNIRNEEEWEKVFDQQPDAIKKIFVGSRMIKFILDNVKFYQPDFFDNLRLNYDRSFVVHRCISKVVKIYRNDFKKGKPDIEFSSNSSSKINGDKEYFEILIKILIENATKYSEYPKDIGPKVIMNDEGNHLVIKVYSYGRAIPDAETPYLFSKGFRSSVNKSNKEGTGMGLFNAQQLVKHFRGSINFECESIKTDESIHLAWNIFVIRIDKSKHKKKK
jgi:hypothetical protein